jgi:hypothetical protein
VRRRATVGSARHGGGADGSRRWEPMEAGGGSRRTGLKGRAEQAGFGGSEGETKMGRAMKWAECQGGYSINSFFLNFKQDFRFKNRRFEILLN